MRTFCRSVLVAALAVCGGNASAQEPKHAERESSAPSADEQHAATPASGEATTAAASERPVPRSEDGWRWYGWQILAVDGATLTTFVGAAVALERAEQQAPATFSTTNRVLAWLAFTHYAVDGFAMHAVHGRWVIAEVSVGLRVLLPLIGVFVGRGVGNQSFDSDGVVVGVLGGMLAAVALDFTVLSVEPPPSFSFATPPSRATSRKSAAVQWFPVVNVSPMDRRSPGAILGIGARF
jgi:hypothetical protein